MVRGLVVFSVAVAAGCGRTPIYLDELGVVRVGFEISSGASGDPYAGTASVVVELDYLDCILDFYADDPRYRLDGVRGAKSLADAQGPYGLCGSGEDLGLDCDVVAIEEVTGQRPGLRVEYDVRGLTEGTHVLFGPLPTKDLTQCDPTVRVGSNEAVQGFDAAGALLWKVISFDPDKAQTNQGQAIEIRAGPP